MSAVRRPAVVGSFYSADPHELADTVDSLLAAVSGGPANTSRGLSTTTLTPSTPRCAGLPEGTASPVAPGRPSGSLGAANRPPKALVVPHAGYVYSGPVAASGYARLRGDLRRRVVLVGPSHFFPLRGIAGSSARRWRTPLGDVPVFTVGQEPVNDAAHRSEHSLEVQLPFLQRVLGGALAVRPLAVGTSSPDQVADVLEPAWQDPDVLLVCSTDLSHYHDADTARRLDERTAQAMVACDVDAIAPQDACGAEALRGLLTGAKRHAAPVRMLDLRTSADTAGDPRRVVGYGAFTVG